ncbi:uroporphyrinogen decarboxylase family protein [Candidatus Chloroploca sp. Khr17]|uniref:uroporphyrinogen decarboxylase family protein n=1 Tax=Candidatus Chloroploca sp. Khr17 TaxID=2496869 RepID=UPI00101DE440|nr:uroporphyrinogen decarboxylase family protein [Candidatus Chloroploca sp. Khr17]
MNSLERIHAALHFQPHDRVPVIAQVFGHAAILAGVDLKTYVQDGAVLAACQRGALAYYDYDAVFALMDTSVETEAVGSVLAYRTNAYPTVQTYVFAKRDDLAQLHLPDPQRDGRMPELLKAIQILRQAVGDEVLVVGCVVGPMTLVSQLMSLQEALYLAIDAPEQFIQLLDFATRVIIRFGLAQIEAGAHLPIIFDPASCPEVIPVGFFRELILPRLKTIVSTFTQAGAICNWLHVAGNATTILPFYPEAGVAIANFDFCVDPARAMQALPQTCLDGNLKPLAFVDASPAFIADEATHLLQHFAQRGGFILSSGCEIPLEARPENITALVQAVR